jgi:hypothetical protein
MIGGGDAGPLPPIGGHLTATGWIDETPSCFLGFGADGLSFTGRGRRAKSDPISAVETTRP